MGFAFLLNSKGRCKVTKTQESVLKQRISGGVFLMLFFGISQEVWAYSSVAPLEIAAGPTQGLIFEPRVSVTELNLNLAMALSSELSVYGRYSLQNDQRLGVNLNLLRNEDVGLNSVFEASLAPDSTLRLTAGFKATLPVRIKGLPLFDIAASSAFSYDLASEITSLPLSITLQHDVESSGFFYGAGLACEVSPSDLQTGYSFIANSGYQTRSGIQYKLMASAPLISPTLVPGASAAGNAATVSLGLVIPFGGEEVAQTPPKSFSSPYNQSVPSHYDLDAKIISMNEALFLLKINKGSSDSIAKGQSFDIYSEDQFLARAEVISVKKDEAALTVVEYKQEHWIELGFSARRLGE
jgi:hypothetical protein